MRLLLELSRRTRIKELIQFFNFLAYGKYIFLSFFIYFLNLSIQNYGLFVRDHMSNLFVSYIFTQFKVLKKVLGIRILFTSLHILKLRLIFIYKYKSIKIIRKVRIIIKYKIK